MPLPLVVRGARRHPFRRHVRQVVARQRKASEDGDVKLFVLSFTAFFVCFYTFLL
ncbi:hypothetical protein [Sphingomonas elodea]|uniref:hypothetical protein n=1 Tax=Sphingomonas elodea TaxID=179878 RepID=UPI0002E8EE9F|nr:hypothetical protein [Sphingomonas elodea]